MGTTDGINGKLSGAGCCRDISSITRRIEQKRNLAGLSGHVAQQLDPRLSLVAGRNDQTNARKSLTDSLVLLNSYTRFLPEGTNYPSL
jgi:hypothetical protein